MATAKMAEEAAKNIVCEREQSDKIWREPSRRLLPLNPRRPPLRPPLRLLPRRPPLRLLPRHLHMVLRTARLTITGQTYQHLLRYPVLLICARIAPLGRAAKWKWKLTRDANAMACQGSSHPSKSRRNSTALPPVSVVCAFVSAYTRSGVGRVEGVEKA